MTTPRRLTKGLIAPPGSFRLARWASFDENVRRFRTHVRKVEREAARTEPPLIKIVRMRRRWRERAAAAGVARS